MKKKYLIFVVIILVVGVLIFLFIPKNNIRFKKEYESLNNQKSESGKKYRKLTVSKANPFVYSSDKKILKMVNKKKSFIVYFGANWCPWCRSIIPSMIKSAKKNNIDIIYYVDITNIRDSYKAVGNIPELEKEGTKAYYELLKKFNNVLNDYTLKEDNETIDVGEKRIFAPNIIKIENGKSISMISGTKYLKDPYMKLTDEITNKIEKSFDDFFENK